MVISFTTNGVSSGTTRYNVKMAKKKGDDKVNPAPQSDNEEQNFDEEPNFEDPEDYVDDITDEGTISRRLGWAGHMHHSRNFWSFSL